MANVNIALDEIITKGRGRGQRRAVGNGGSGSGGGRRSTGFRSDNLFNKSRSSPGGKWKHDKFNELYSGGGGASKRRGGVIARGGIKSARSGGGGSSEIVKLNISDLPETVLTADLEELFQDFGIYGVTVHYDETGAHLGTADLFTDFRSAKDIIREYANIAIDGQEIKIAVVDESGKLSGAVGGRARIQDRIRRVANNPIRRRKENQRASGGGGGGGRRGSGGPGGSGGGPRRAGKPTAAAPKLKKMTTEELDKELEAYMGSRHPQIQ